MAARQLVITDHGSYVSVSNMDGIKAQGADVERALVVFARKYGLDLIEGTPPSSTFEMSIILDTLLGRRRDQGQIHTGVLSG